MDGGTVLEGSVSRAFPTSKGSSPYRIIRKLRMKKIALS